jgi:metal-sulfur cluster biosynthetic enzyme
MITKEQAIDALKLCEDPELNIDVWTLGLIYDLDVNDGKVKIKMTFTTPLCPYGPMLLDTIKMKLTEHGASNVDLEVVFDPPWKPSEELREMLGV